jgi:DUF917 family protein
MPNKNGKTVKELKETIRKHNQKNCIKLSGNKKALAQRIAQHGLSQQGGAGAGAGAPVNNIQNLVKKKKKKKKRIQPTLISSSTGGSSGGNILGSGGAGNSVGQKNFKKKLKKQKKAYKKLKGVDANPEWAF